MESSNILEIMHTQVQYAENKNSGLIVFSAAIIVGLVSNVENIIKLFTFNEPIFKRSICADSVKLYLIILIIHYVVSIVMNLISFAPKYKIRIKNEKDRNGYYFSDNSMFKDDKSLAVYLKSRYKEDLNEENDKINQIYNLSRIARRKYFFFRYSLLLVLISPLSSFLIQLMIERR